jgi:two-component system KDP operon response regulator KdpE
MTIVIVVDSDERGRRSALRYLAAADHAVEEATDGPSALRKIYTLRPDAVVLDLDVPVMDGEELTRVIRALSDRIAIVVVAATHDPDVTVRVLDLGADDFIQKPCTGPELVARVSAAIRGAARQTEGHEQSLVVRTGDLTIDREAHILKKGNRAVQLTPTEFRLPEALALHVGKLVPHRFLLSSVWGDEFVNDTHYLRTYVASLRQKLEDDPSRPVYLLSEWGMGYRLAAIPRRSASENVPLDDGRVGTRRRQSAARQTSV